MLDAPSNKTPCLKTSIRYVLDNQTLHFVIASILIWMYLEMLYILNVENLLSLVKIILCVKFFKFLN